MKLVVLESPYAGDLERNTRYLHACMRDALARNEAPFASHELYTRALSDGKAEERALGIEAGLQWGRHASTTVVYTDLGISPGMKLGIARAQAEGRPVVYRSLGWAEGAAE